MHRLLVTLALLALPALAGCGGVTMPLTGTTPGGGVIARESALLSIPVPGGMDFYPEHSRMTNGDGMEIFRGDASPTLCARVVTDNMQSSGWTCRLAQAGQDRALYAFEKNGRLAVITIQPQSPTTLTLLTIYTASTPPQGIPVPVREKSSFSFGFGSSSSSSDSTTDTGAADQGAVDPGASGLSTAPEPAGGSGGQIQERDL